MNSINSFTSARKGVSGLMSGLDTDELVKGMTLPTTTRITKLLQSRQKNAWKTESYQGITSQLNDFANKYLSMSSSSSIYSNKFFENASTKPSEAFEKYLTVVGSSTTSDRLSIVGVTQTATTSSIIGKKTLSNNKITTGEVDFSATGKVVNNLNDEMLNVSYEGKRYNISLKDFEFTATDEAGRAKEITDAINTEMAKIDIGNSQTLADKFEMKIDSGAFSFAAKAQGDSSKVGSFKIEGGSGKILEALSLKAGSTATNDEAIVGEAFSADNFERELNFGDTLKGKSMSFTLNGVTKDILFDDSMSYGNAEDFATSLNKKLDQAFGAGRVKVDANNVGGVYDNTFSFQAFKGGNVDTTSILSISSKSIDVVGEKGVFNSPSRLNSRISLTDSVKNISNSPFTLVDGKGSLEINGVKIDYTENDSIKGIMDKINSSSAGATMVYMQTTDTFSITSKITGDAGQIDISDTQGNFSSVVFDAAVETKGQDSIIQISYDGGKTVQEIQRDGNSFDIDGLNITLKNGIENAGISVDKPITFTAEPKTDEIVKGIKSLIDDYNKLSAVINKELSTKPNRNYAPLTDEQRKEMSETQIEDWEKQAKAGTLYGDSTLRSLSSELRFIFSFDVEGATSLKEMGISTSSSYYDNGKIVIDEAKLRAALENDPGSVQKAFNTQAADPKNATSAQIGIADKIKAVTDKYAKTEGAMESKGLLVQIAGYKDAPYILETSLKKEDNTIQEQLTRLKSTLKMQEDRYYSQFTALEKYIAQMEAQSGWMSSNM